jgi:hypothetical protein
MQRSYKATGFAHIAADSHMHTAVRCCERFNTSLRAMARAAYFDSAYQWDVWLPFISSSMPRDHRRGSPAVPLSSSTPRDLRASRGISSTRRCAPT